MLDYDTDARNDRHTTSPELELHTDRLRKMSQRGFRFMASKKAEEGNATFPHQGSGNLRLTKTEEPWGKDHLR